MNAKELRIGNYVKTPVGYELLVRDISIDMIVLTGNAVHGNLQKHYVEFILPIPITNEWLVKLVLKKKEHFAEWVVDDKYSVMLYKGQYRLQAETVLGSYTIAKIEYVHQLQNLYFALTGEDLTL